MTMLSWRLFLIMLGMVALATIAYSNWDEIAEAWQLTEGASWQVLLLLPLLQLASFWAYAMFYQTSFAIFGYRQRLAKLYRVTLGVNFVNQITPSLGVTAISFLYYGLDKEVPTGKIALVQYGKYMLSWLAFLPIILAGVAMVYIGGDIHQVVAHVVIGVMVAAAAVVAIFVYLITSRRRFDGSIYFLQKTINRLGGLLRRSDEPLVKTVRINNLLKDFHTGFELIAKHRKRLATPFAYSFLMLLFEVAVLYTVFVALGQTINPGIVIIAYAVAAGASLFSIIPGDVGIFEVAMVAGFNSVGVPVSEAISATLIFRIVNKLLFLPAGFYFYTRALGKRKSLPRVTTKPA